MVLVRLLPQGHCYNVLARFRHLPDPNSVIPLSSAFDELYRQLFGTTCTREGQAYERIASVVAALLFPDSVVAHDKRLRGIFSKSLYQIDVLREDKAGTSFGEAKDYTQRQAKVGRGDLQKMGGALQELPVDGGTFYSATGFTREARRYASASPDIIGRPIDLMHVRQSVAKDMEGRFTKIVLSVVLRVPDYENATFNAIWTKDGERSLSRLLEPSQIGKVQEIPIDRFMDADGKLMLTIEQLTSQGFGETVSDEALGCFWLPKHYVEMEKNLIELHGIEYRVPFLDVKEDIEIVAQGEPKILVRSDDGAISKIITDEHLRKMEFDENGIVRPKVAGATSGP